MKIKCIIFDKDNTLTEPDNKTYFNENIKNGIIKDCLNFFDYSQVGVVSNGIDNYSEKDIAVLETNLGIKLIKTNS